jgi:predicted Zn-dependent protease
MKKLLFCVFAVIACVTGPAWAAGGGGSDGLRDTWQDAGMEQLQAAIDRADWPQARELARAGVEKNPSSADYHNLYAYALRKGPNPDMALVFKHYNEALRLDPKHKGATEYLGEAYLMIGNLEKAKQQLKALDELCFFSCKETTLLKKAIADYEAKASAK